MKYDLLIPVSPKDYDVLPYCLRSIHHLSPAPNQLFLASPVREGLPEIAAECGVDPIIVTDEELFAFAGQGKKPGWFQQLIKLFQDITHDNYLVWDSDLVLTRKFPVFGFENRPFMRYHLNDATNVNEAYNAFMLEAFGQQPAIHMTMVCHHMLFHRDILKEMIRAFIRLHPKPEPMSDAEWFYRWLSAKGREYELSVSEYEAYAHFVLGRFPARYELRKASLADFVFFKNDRTPQAIRQRLGRVDNTMVAFHRRDDSISHQWHPDVGSGKG